MATTFGFATILDSSSAKGGTDACNTAAAFSTAGVPPSAAFSKLGTAAHKSPPPDNADVASVTSVVKLFPEEVNSDPKLVSIFASLDVYASTSPILVFGSARRLVISA